MLVTPVVSQTSGWTLEGGLQERTNKRAGVGEAIWNGAAWEDEGGGGIRGEEDLTGRCRTVAFLHPEVLW